MHYQPHVKASHHSGDELPIGYKSGEKEGKKTHEIRTSLVGTKEEVPGLQSESMSYHNRRIREMMPRHRS